MNRSTKQDLIRNIAAQNQKDADGALVLWSRHATVELVNENWNRGAVEVALITSEVIEDYPTLHRPLPDCLVLGTMPSGEPIHAVIAIDTQANKLFVVTIYCPSLEEWENDWRTRK